MPGAAMSSALSLRGLAPRQEELGRTLEATEAAVLQIIAEAEAEKEAMLSSYRRALEDSQQQLAAQKQARSTAEERVRVLEEALDRQQALLLIERSHLQVALGKLERIGKIRSVGASGQQSLTHSGDG